MSVVVEELLKQHASIVDAYLQDVLSRLDQLPPRLIESMIYSVTSGGKRLRPALVLECYRACGGRMLPGHTDAQKPFDTAVSAAAAIELIHTFSLVHDDLPAMDDDELRRGRPTNHIVFGEAMAILAGDAMVALAFGVLDQVEQVVAPALVRELATSTMGMIGGQVLDIEGESKTLSLTELQQVHAFKTGQLLTAACRIGTIAAGASAPQLDRLTQYGKHLGLAFQIVDDLLDVTSTPEELGKKTNKDAGGGKNTYPRLLGIDGSRAEASKQVEQRTGCAIDVRPIGGWAPGAGAVRPGAEPLSELSTNNPHSVNLAAELGTTGRYRITRTCSSTTYVIFHVGERSESARSAAPE